LKLLFVAAFKVFMQGIRDPKHVQGRSQEGGGARGPTSPIQICLALLSTNHEQVSDF